MTLGRTPIKIDILLKMLENYPNITDKTILAEGFQFGFRVGYNGPRTPTCCYNLTSAYQHDIALEKILLKELKLGRIAGHFSLRPLSNLRISPIGLVPKKSGGWRLIHNLSHPLGNSVNSHIDPNLASVKYTSFDKVLNTICESGPKSLMGRMDISSAFRLLIINPSDFELFGFKFRNLFFFDKCLPMGCSVSCCLFEKFANFLEWIVRERSHSNSTEHYLDDFFFVGKSCSNICFELMSTFHETCVELGVPLADEKTIGPDTVIIFLGLEIDTNLMVIRVPKEKLEEAKDKLNHVLTLKKVTLKILQSLIGLLQFCARALPMARAFIRRFCDATCGVKKPHHFIRVSVGMKEDIIMWLRFLDQFNGTCKFSKVVWQTNVELNLFTDSSGNHDLGSAVYFVHHWAYFSWPADWLDKNVMRELTFLELVPVVMAVFMFKKDLQDKQIIFHTDNEALVSVLNNRTSKSKNVMQLVRPLVLETMLFNIQWKSLHIRGRNNCIADAISRRQWVKFKILDPQADAFPTQIPQDFRTLISKLKLEG